MADRKAFLNFLRRCWYILVVFCTTALPHPLSRRLDIISIWLLLKDSSRRRIRVRLRSFFLRIPIRVTSLHSSTPDRRHYNWNLVRYSILNWMKQNPRNHRNRKISYTSTQDKEENKWQFKIFFQQKIYNIYLLWCAGCSWVEQAFPHSKGSNKRVCKHPVRKAEN